MKLITITRILGKLDQIPAKHFLGNFSRLPEWNLHKKTVDAVLFLDPPFNTTARDCPQEWRNRKEKSLILKYEKRGLLRPLLPIIPFFCDSSLLSRRSLIRVELKIKKKKKKKKKKEKEWSGTQFSNLRGEGWVLVDFRSPHGNIRVLLYPDD